jgi:pyocin large subunit-like protein
MSRTAINAACKCQVRPTAKAVLKELAWFADDAGENIWPSVKTLAERTGLSRRAVQKLLRELEHMGAIQALGSRLGGRHKTTRYRMDFGWLEASAKTANGNRPFVPQNSGEKRNGEPQNSKRANGSAENSEPRSPEQKEHEYEQKKKPLSFKTERRQATSYEYQQLQQKARKISSSKSMPCHLTKEQLANRRLDLRRQAEEAARKYASGGNTS